MPQDVTSYLKAVPTDDQTRAQAWEVYNNPANQQDFEQRVGKLNIPQQAKSDLWEAKYGSGKLNSPNFQAPPPPTSTSPTPAPAQPAPTAGESFLHKAYNWATSPVHLAGIPQTIADTEARADAPPTLNDAKSSAASAAAPWYHPKLDMSRVHQLEAGLDSFGAGAAKMLLTPLSIATAPLGVAAKDAGVVGTGAKAILASTGIGFGAKGAADVVQHPLPQKNEAGSDYATRLMGDAAMVTGGAAGVSETPEIVRGAKGVLAANRQAPTPPTVQNTSAPTPEAVAQARVQQAVGGPGQPVAQTIHVDPDFANELDQWNRNQKLSGKRIILKENAKTGEQTVHLAHSDPDVSDFQYTNTTSSNVYSDVGADGQVPVELSKSNGVRGTAVKGNFLANRIVGDIHQAAQPSVAAPETPAPAPVEPPATQPPTPKVEPPPVAPAGWQNHPNFPQPEANTNSLAPKAVEPSTPTARETAKANLLAKVNSYESPREVAQKTGKVVTTPNGVSYGPGGSTSYSTSVAIPPVSEPAGGVSPGLPDELSKSAPSYGYGSKLFQLQFEDPHDLAAYTLGQAKDNAAQPKFLKYLRSEYPDATDQDLKDHALGVRATVKDMAKVGNPDDGPLKVPSQGGIATSGNSPTSTIGKAGEPIAVPKAGVPAEISQAPTPPEDKPLSDVSPLEDKIRPLVGELLNGHRLALGEAASHAIDLGIEKTHTPGDSIPDKTADQLSTLLKEPVEDKLTEDQEAKLETLRGGKQSDTAKITYHNKFDVEKKLSGEFGEKYEQVLGDSQLAMLKDLSDPNTPADIKAKISEALEPDAQGNQKYVTYDRGMEYPRPTDIDPDHPEAPFISKQLGHSITANTMENLKASLSRNIRDKFLSSEGSDPYVTADERKGLEALKKQDNLTNSDEESQAGSPKSFSLSDVIGTPEDSKGSVISPRMNGGDYQNAVRLVQQRALARRLGKTAEVLKGQVGEWNKQRNGAQTTLTDQLSKLPADVRKYLPSELFDYEKPNEAQTDGTTPSAGNEQPVKASNKTKKSSAAPKSGIETSVEGLKTNKFDGIIQKKFKAQVPNVEMLRDGIADKYPVQARQSIYDQTMEIFHQGLVADDPFALKKAVDVFKRTNEAGFVNLTGKGSQPFSDEEIRSINAASADKMLERWEAMSQSELLKKQAGLTKDSLVQRIEGAAPVSDDPVIRAQQMDTYNELKERHTQLRQVVGPTTNLHDSLVDWAKNFVEARPDKQVMRQVRGTQYRNDAILRNTFDGVDKLMNNLPIPEQDRFFDNMSRGTDQTDDLFKAMDPKFIQKWEKTNGSVPDPNDLALRIRQSFDAATQRVTQASGHLAEFIINYMPGMYDNQAKARPFAQSWASRRPLEGSSEFLKQKMYEFHVDALKAGLTPTTSNSVRAMMMRVEQLNRFSMAHEFKNQLVDQGFADWYNTGETPPEGHEALNDRIFGQGGLGNYFAPSKVARTFNNFVSAGLTGGWKVPYTNLSLYDTLKSTNNLANQMQLGLSVFHGVETTLNSGFTSMAVGLRQVFNQGKIFKGAVNIAKGATFITPLIEDAWNGQKGLVNFRDPTQELNYAQLGSDLEMANANVRTNPNFELQQIRRLKDNWAHAADDLQPARSRGVALAKAAGNVLSSGVEATSYPLMTSLIPRVKVGAFYRMAQQIHEEYAGQPPDVINGELQKAWDSVDNRFGQVNYDNMFMNKTFKDVMALSVRSPGWNIGTLREVGGGILDFISSVKDAAQGKGVKISNRTAYTASMVVGTMFVNAMYHYLHTGQPAEGMDYFFPKDGTKSAQGEDNRVYPKTYVYDFINLYHDPVHTVWHKAAPDISTIADLIQNEDYYHHQIRDPGNDPVQNAASVLGYMAHQFVPFSFGNLQESQLRGQSGKIEPFAGILPAPRWAGRTNAENLAFQYFGQTQATDANDPQSLERKQDFVNLRNKVTQGTVTDDQIQDAIDKGKLNPKMVKYLYESKSDPQIVTWTKNLRSPAHVWNVWQAASPEEKKILLPTIIEKMSNLSSGEEQEKYITQLEEFANQQ